MRFYEVLEYIKQNLMSEDQIPNKYGCVSISKGLPESYDPIMEISYYGVPFIISRTRNSGDLTKIHELFSQNL